MQTYSSHEVAPILKIHVDTVRRYIREGRLRAVNVATSHRPKYVITEEALREFLERNTAATAINQTSSFKERGVTRGTSTS